MSKITEFNIIKTVPQQVLTIETIVQETEIIKSFVDGIYKIGNYIQKNRSIPADLPYMRIDVGPDEKLKVTVGTAIPEDIKSNEEIQNNVIPGGKKVICYYQGNNDEMGEFYSEMEEFIAKSGHKKKGSYYEYFLNGIEFGIENLLTKVICEIE